MAVGLQYGGVCRDCKGLHKCKDKPTALSPISMECTECSGLGCKECKDVGTVDIEVCPLYCIGSDMQEVLEYADLYKKGLPPVMGGSLDQSKSFILACNFIFREQYYWKSKLGIIDNG